MTPSYQILTLITRTPDKMISSLMIPDPVFNTIIYTCQLCTDSICNKTKQARGKTKLLRTTASTLRAKPRRFIFLMICTLECIIICDDSTYNLLILYYPYSFDNISFINYICKMNGA